ncbi:MAG TPA: hypothetical protein VE549_07765, partial [Myxococcaceae bacterium]|nr:hypothetical protein [Myxococcaceae bacterium]
GKYLERTYDFVERIGIEKLRGVLVHDAEGVAARLDSEIQAAVDAYVDPWASEGEQPVHLTQFAAELRPPDPEPLPPRFVAGAPS